MYSRFFHVEPGQEEGLVRAKRTDGGRSVRDVISSCGEAAEATAKAKAHGRAPSIAGIDLITHVGTHRMYPKIPRGIPEGYRMRLLPILDEVMM